MNYKSIGTTIGTGILVIIGTGCGPADEEYEYEVSGVVEAAQIDYECEGDLALEPAAFVAGKTPGGGGPSSNKKDDKKADDSATDGDQSVQDDNRRDAAASSPPRRGSGTSSTPQASRAPSAVQSSAQASPKPTKGVRLSKKPSKPERVTKVSPPKYKVKPEGCETEYELFVRNGDGLFEQDVRETDYDKCPAREDFPACTKG